MSDRAGAGAPSGGDSAAAVFAVAAELFAELPYHQVRIRDIAERAGLSPAMVMKCAGSKLDLFYRAATIAAPPIPDVPRAELGKALVDGVIDRAERDQLEPLTRALLLRLAGPDPDAVQEQVRAAYLQPLAEHLGGQDARLRAELVVAALAGLAATYRLFDAAASRAVPEEAARRYADVVQRLIDGP